MVRRDPSHDPPTGPGKLEDAATADAYAESARSMLRQLDANAVENDSTLSPIQRDRRRFEEAQAVGLAQAWATLAVYELLRELRIVAVAAFAVLCILTVVVILGVMS